MTVPCKRLGSVIEQFFVRSTIQIVLYSGKMNINTTMTNGLRVTEIRLTANMFVAVLAVLFSR